jgi:hypothetical protein
MAGFDRHFEHAAGLMRESLLFVLVRRAADAARRSIDESRGATAIRSMVDQFGGLAAAARLRIVGVFLLSAACVNAVLLLMVPRSMAPAPPFAMPVVAGVAALVMIIKSSR